MRHLPPLSPQSDAELVRLHGIITSGQSIWVDISARLPGTTAKICRDRCDAEVFVSHFLMLRRPNPAPLSAPPPSSRRPAL